MVRVLHEEPTFSRIFIDHLLTHTLRVDEDLVDQPFNSSEWRLARTLLLLANFDKGGIPEPIIGEISQENNDHRVHQSLNGSTPGECSGQPPPVHAFFDHYSNTWRNHCCGLFQMLIAA